ncbi:predicted protein [Uncinocarpus reesii 1704]|uniref:Uncharacterized protein n=1 Tax=Uncinocarpus reesii (strain UAMH 1704) TaxID=336963 RepID=C4JJD8_UNCRE|nr:uncharacterized protein UREG_01745 [Uncinocarpus reesii 1704]EEP76896.1 predicted protein [Uncinocarpus reesii 1704]
MSGHGAGDGSPQLKNSEVDASLDWLWAAEEVWSGGLTERTSKPKSPRPGAGLSTLDTMDGTVVRWVWQMGEVSAVNQIPRLVCSEAFKPVWPKVMPAFSSVGGCQMAVVPLAL